MIYLFSSKTIAALGLDKKDSNFKILPVTPGRELSALKSNGYDISSSDQIYLDITSLTPTDLKKSLAQLKKSAVFWGIIDPKGSSPDPALFFFEGGGDYIGPAVLKTGLSKKRFALALSRPTSGKAAASGKKADDDGKVKSKTVKLPVGKFEGWKSIRIGTEGTFFFLFVSLSGKSNFRSMLGDAAFAAMRLRLREVLQQGLSGTDALLWMETEQNSIFLVPPRKINGMAVIEAALKLLANSHLVAVEKLGLTSPVEFTFVLHYGETLFQAPGKTGAIISESVNYIFHLATKRAEPSRLTISCDVPEDAFPDGLKDLFLSVGTFEGVPIKHSKRFTFK